MATKGRDIKPLSPTTTVQEDKVTAGQRRINIIWESTQSIIAVMVTGAVIYNAINGIENKDLGQAFILILSVYYIRTNHQLIGGVKPNQVGR